MSSMVFPAQETPLGGDTVYCLPFEIYVKPARLAMCVPAHRTGTLHYRCHPVRSPLGTYTHNVRYLVLKWLLYHFCTHQQHG